MPIEVGLWRIDKEPEKVEFSVLESEKKLEEVLEKDLSLLSQDLLPLGRQVATAHGKFIDLLAMNGDGDLVVICQSAFNIDPLSASKNDPPRIKKMLSISPRILGLATKVAQVFFCSENG
ncbi:hypothetical protein KKF97_04560, partial [Myxococcota bacterium]|nr:hypothetical protein [Myxococcota bacterium]